MGEELLPFTVYDVENKQTLKVDPMRTGGQQPFIGVNTETGVETPIEPPFFIHYDMETRKRYVLDLQKVGAAGGKFKFKDPESGEEVVADITQRVDPLSGLPLFGDYQNPDREFIATIKDGQIYVVKDPVTGDIEIINNNGQPVLEYSTVYDPETNTTNILDEQGESVLVLDGKQLIQLNLPEDTLEEIERKDLLKGGLLVDKRPKLRTGQKREARDEFGEPYDEESSSENMEYSEDGEMVDENEELLYDKDGNVIGIKKEPTSHDGIDLYDFDREREKAGSGIIRDPSLGQMGQLHIQVNPNTGSFTIVDKEGNKVNLPSGSRFETDPVTGNMRLVNENGEPIDMMQTLGETPVKQEDQQADTSLDVGAKPSLSKKNLLFGDQLPQREKTEEEKYFESLKSDDAYSILEEMKKMDDVSRSAYLKCLSEAIELQKKFIECSMKVKIEQERKFIVDVMKEKKTRQNQYIRNILQRNVNNYDRHEVEKEIFDKLDRENEYLFDKLEEKITNENTLVNEAMLKEFEKCRESIVRKTNTNCYKRCRRILIKQLGVKLGEEIKNVKQELCAELSRERNEIQHIVETFYTNKSY
ncbi:hypothetical protein WDU94_013651 [Cyamophila willieti]